MLKPYQRPPMSMELFTKRVVVPALEYIGYPDIPINVGANLCYLFLTKRYKELLQLAKKTFPDIKDDRTLIANVAKMANIANGRIICEEVEKYRKFISDNDVKEAMETCGVKAPLTLIPLCVSAFVVDGESGLSCVKPILDEEGVTKADIRNIVQLMSK